MRFLMLVLVVVGCTSEQSVLGISEVTTCDQAFLATAGTPCEFVGTCQRASPTDPVCCSDTAYCGGSGLVTDSSCNPDCTTCIDDRQCAAGAAICTAGHCMPCPDTASCAPPNSPACPSGWQQLERNGCPTCDCAPPSECSAGDPNQNNCPTQEVCYEGARCAEGCAPGDECCANVCSAQGCQGPAPLGCLMNCVNTPCNQCAADACECVGGSWVCQERCVDGEGVTASCIAA